MVPSSVSDTLFLPIERGDIAVSERTLFLNAAPHPALAQLEACDLWQPFFPLAEALSRQNGQVLEELPAAEPYDLVLLLLPKQAAEAKALIAQALQVLKPGGVFLAAGGNDSGGARLGGWMKELGLVCESLSKNKARAVWLTRPETLPPLVLQWAEEGGVQKIQYGDGLEMFTQPGLFSWNHPDPASVMLASCLPEKLSGDIADFGCGIGYLSCRLSGVSGPRRLTMIEADRRALDCARMNVEPLKGMIETEYLWADLSRPVPGLAPLDAIMMNPPFHSGKSTDIALGQSFLATASKHLKKGGQLWLVANVQLPYEQPMQALFQSVQPLKTQGGFKVIKGLK